MNEALYPVLGATPGEALGRAAELRRLKENLSRSTPANLCVIGPRHAGKSFLLRRFVREARSVEGPCQAVVLLDLRAETPTTDAAFHRALANAVADEIRADRPDLMADTLDYEWLGLVVQALAGEERFLLVVLDGMDAVLHREGITEGLWQNLRALAQLDGLRFVTGSRAPLRELCASEASATSNFWEIFHTEPVLVGGFTHDDWDEVLAPLRGLRTVEDSGRKEITAWCGGIPLLAAALLRRLSTGRGPVDAPAVASAAEALLRDQVDLLESLWDDCTAEMHGDLADAVRAPVAVSKVPLARRRALALRGLAEESGGTLHVRSKLVQRFVGERDVAVSELRRHFADVASYERNIPRVLEYRLAQVPRGKVAPNLRSKVEKAVRELASGTPEDTLTWLRSVFELGFALAWGAEVSSKKLPEAWFTVWRTTSATDLPDPVPHSDDPARLLGVLRFAMGRQGVPRVTRYVTKRTYILLSTLKDAGDFGQHPDSGQTPVGTLAVWCLAAIELLERLHAELPG